MSSNEPAYDCLKCPGYCCSYPVIKVNKRDIQRLAKHFDITFEAAERKYVKSAHGEERVLRRKTDEHFGKTCKMFDQKLRRCGVYEARPDICRKFPQEKVCGYYDFLMFERKHQEDPEFVATTDNGAWA